MCLRVYFAVSASCSVVALIGFDARGYHNNHFVKRAFVGVEQGLGRGMQHEHREFTQYGVEIERSSGGVIDNGYNERAWPQGLPEG